MPGLKQALLDPVPEVQKRFVCGHDIVMIIVMGMLVMVVYSSLVLSSLLVAMMTCSLFSFQPYRLSSVLLIVDNDDDDELTSGCPE